MARARDVNVAPRRFTINPDGTVFLRMSEGSLGIVREVMAVDFTETVEEVTLSSAASLLSSHDSSA